ncbi:RNA-binding S4 domain-containing protein [Parasphingopyxis sp. CP4]|uniref:RNA-binding S4 domain-containing protein n=1 Tax=Parasphingopyxis sp. CP4 TaxID=2724527 RepID=UPI0015A34BB6|nr:S4 domain-containing protein [Parasphingopyxis sp. CP4]QLC22824.1 RNA-binding S4 domain-containing protein [Parasphingopyxis sp. CP4]
MTQDDGLRIDKFLWFSRLTRTRSLAQKIAEKGHIRCAGRRIDRAHAVVRVGDVLSVPMPNGVRVLRVESLPERRVPAKLVDEIYSRVERISDTRR